MDNLWIVPNTETDTDSFFLKNGNEYGRTSIRWISENVGNYPQFYPDIRT